jgi:hypothetical protein
MILDPPSLEPKWQHLTDLRRRNKHNQQLLEQLQVGLHPLSVIETRLAFLAKRILTTDEMLIDYETEYEEFLSGQLDEGLEQAKELQSQMRQQTLATAGGLDPAQMQQVIDQYRHAQGSNGSGPDGPRSPGGLWLGRG